MAYLRLFGLVAGLLLLMGCALPSSKTDPLRSGPEVLDISGYA